MKKTSNTTKLHDLIVHTPKDTRIVIKEIEEQTGINYRKLMRLKSGNGATMTLTDATLLANYFSQYFPETKPEDFNTEFSELATKLNAAK